ncbi:hypothetical protein D0Y65_009518, partial [Glycine soja]
GLWKYYLTHLFDLLTLSWPIQLVVIASQLIQYFAVGSAYSLVSLWDISEMLYMRTFTKLDSSTGCKINLVENKTTENQMHIKQLLLLLHVVGASLKACNQEFFI